MPHTLRAFLTLIRREAWEYRAWWTILLWAIVGVGAIGLCIMTGQARSHDPDALAFQDSFFLRWNHGLFLGGAGIMALAHAAHGVFDERQDRSIGFWQSFPVPEHMRLLAKSVAIAWGWPLLAATADSALTVVALAKSLAMGHFAAQWVQVFPTWTRMIIDCGLAAAWSWPLVCGWLCCSAIAPRTPWAWGIAGGAAMYFVAQALGLEPWGMAGAVALGPALPALAGATGEWARLPWQTGSVAWFLSYPLGWGVLRVAARRVGDAAQL